jgi:hypothetical protein
LRPHDLTSTSQPWGTWWVSLLDGSCYGQKINGQLKTLFDLRFPNHGRNKTLARRGKNTQLLLPNLLRQSIYSRLAGYEDLNNAELLSQDRTFRLGRF